MRDLIASAHHEAFDLLEILVSKSAYVAKTLGDMLQRGDIQTRESRLLPAISLILDLPAAMDVDQMASDIAKAAVNTLKDRGATDSIQDAAGNILHHLAATHSEVASQAFSSLEPSQFNLAIAKVAGQIASIQLNDTSHISQHLVSIGLRWAARALSNDAPLSVNDLETLKQIGESVIRTPVLNPDNIRQLQPSGR